MESDLLQPSIGGAAPARPIYSHTALFVPAFFGGPVAAAIMFGANAARLRRLPQDAAWIAGGALLLLIAPWLAMQSEALQPHLRFVLRGAGLLAAALYAFRHRPHYRAQEMFGVPSPSGWAIGLAATVTGFCANIAVVIALTPR